MIIMKPLVPFASAAVILTILFGTIYVTVQQLQRNDADYPQIQMAEDVASGLDKGADPVSFVASSIDFTTDLSPFTVIYDTAGRPVAGSGRLDGHLPTVPIGVLAAARGKPYSRVTWEPKPGARIAAVTVAARQYYVLSGRSLTQVERNETVTLQLTALGWAASLAALAVTFMYHKTTKKGTVMDNGRKQ